MQFDKGFTPLLKDNPTGSGKKTTEISGIPTPVDPNDDRAKKGTDPTNPSAPSPPGGEVGVGDPPPLLNYDPEQPVHSGPMRTEDVTGTSFEDEATRAYGENSLAVRAARNQMNEQTAGKGLLFSDIGARAAEGAAFDKAMELVSPDVDFKQDLNKNEQEFGFKTKLNEQMNQYDVATQNRMQFFQKENDRIKNEFTKELSKMQFGQDMEKSLLSYMQNALTAGNTMLTQLAMSGEATAAEVDRIQESIRNSLTTFTNIWKASAGSSDTFDFSNIA